MTALFFQLYDSILYNNIIYKDNYTAKHMKDSQKEKIQQDQFHSFVFDETMSWQEIIYDLINSEQLDPWDIDLSTLSEKYLEKIRELEEANFALSSKVLLISSLMLRIKAELLLNRYIKDLDDVLFNKKKEEQQKLNLTEVYDEDIPELLPRTPLPRYKKVSLQELVSALTKAIATEDRRIIRKRVEKESYERTKFFMPKKTINIRERMKEIHTKVKSLFEKHEKIRFSEFAGPKKQDKITHFVPLLHLDNHNHLWLQQENHLDEIWIHKDGKQFIEKDDIITDKIERQFEDSLEKN